MSKKRLSQDRWIEAGLSALAEHGASVLSVESLCREQGISKGSFYWHFRDLQDFHAQLSSSWKRSAASDLVAALEHQGPVATRLQMIAAITPAEREMRAWARSNDAAAAQVTEIDRLRLDATAALLRDLGISNPDLARALYAAAIGLDALPDRPADDHAMETLVDLMLALR